MLTIVAYLSMEKLKVSFIPYNSAHTLLVFQKVFKKTLSYKLFKC